MGGMSIWHWLVVGGIALLLFGGKGKISDIMGDVAKGIKSFKKGMQDEEEKVVADADAKKVDAKTIEQDAAAKVGETQPAKESQKAS
ncbi:MAG: twin-arginine translocase TatA/TatE family subunit [Beijerinckiaceae bacterium]|jgi:sec-independent protein translocase protein TatA|nr:twin-arginine translocase TatA/TatE family subunit [Beijerinckiaceae bacterium]